jgi:hypothetical protein
VIKKTAEYFGPKESGLLPEESPLLNDAVQPGFHHDLQFETTCPEIGSRLSYGGIQPVVPCRLLLGFDQSAATGGLS